MSRSPRPVTRLDWLRRAEVALAVAVLVTTWLDVGVALRSYPTWVYVGDVTLPFAVLLPAAFALVALAAVGAAGHAASLGRRRVAEGVLAGLTLFTAVFAVYNLNAAEPGVYVAGVFPMFLAVVLALVVLVGRGVTAVRRLSVA